MGSAMRRLLDELLGVLDERIHRLVVGGSISSDHGAAVPHEAIQLSSRADTACLGSTVPDILRVTILDRRIDSLCYKTAWS